MKYKKRPIEAIQFLDNSDRIIKIQEFLEKGKVIIDYSNKECPILSIDTFEGIVNCSVRHFIIKGVGGKYHTCSPEIFKQTYESI